MGCCQMATFLYSLSALFISIFSVIEIQMSRRVVQAELLGLGRGSLWMDRMSTNVDWYLVIVMFILALSFMAICMSTYDCACTRGKLARVFSTSRMMCTMRLINIGTFLVNFSCGTVVALVTGLISFCTMVCHMGPGVQYHAQQLVWAIGNDTMGEGGYHRFGEDQEWDTPFISAQEVVRGLSVHQFCAQETWSIADGENAVSIDKHFFLGFAGLTVALVLQAIALHGENERVTVHEEAEKASRADLLAVSGLDYAGGFRSARGLGPAYSMAPLDSGEARKPDWNAAAGLTQY